MAMRMSMGLARGVAGTMIMLMVFIVGMPMIVFHLAVSVFMRMPF